MSRERSGRIATARGERKRVRFRRKGFHPAHAERWHFRLDLRRSLQLHYRITVGIALVGIVLAVGYLWRDWPVYSARALVYIQPLAADASGEGAAAHWPYNFDPAAYESYVREQMQRIKRVDVLKGALEKLRGFRNDNESDQYTIERLGQSVGVGREGISFEVAIRAQARSAQLAADIANAVAASYVESTLQEQRAVESGQIAVLREEASRAKKELDVDRAENAAQKTAQRTELATAIARLQKRYDLLDQQIRDLSAQPATSRTVRVVAAAVAPVHPVADGPFQEAAFLVLAFVMLGALAAIVAHKLDPRLYVATDVKGVVGFAPIAQLPDSSDVSPRAFKEQLLRLSTAIDNALKQDNLKSCVFIGASPGAGVTTIATRVRARMEGMGRPAVLVDAVGKRPTVWPAGSELDEWEMSGAQPLVLMEWLSKEPRDREGVLAFADASPLAASVQTESLARSTDSVIVVVESGVTTRSDLRATSKALKRLDVSEVGVVLNRVKLAKADASFRSSLRAIETQVRLQSRTMAMEPTKMRRVEAVPKPAVRHPVRPAFRALEGNATLVQQAGPQVPAGMPERAEVQTSVTEPMLTPEKAHEQVQVQAPVPEPAQEPVPEAVAEAAQAPVPEVRPQLQAQQKAVEISPAKTEPEGERQRHKEPEQRIDVSEPPEPVSAPPQGQQASLPWWLADPLLHPNVPVQRPPGLEVEAATITQGESFREVSRLSSLKRLFANRTAAPAVGATEQPLAERIESEPENEAQETERETVAVSKPEPEAPVEPEPSIELETAVPSCRPTPEVATVPEILPPRKTGEAKREKGPASRRDRRDTWDDVAVLPSWPGQYRRKRK